MNRTKIINASLLPLHDNLEIIHRGELLIEGNSIRAIGKKVVGPFDKVIDAEDQLVMPGLINTHTHAAMVLYRGFADDMLLMDWLHILWPIEDRLNGDDVYWATLLASLEMLKSGTTTFVDMYFFMDDVARAVEEIGIRAVLSRGLVGLGDDRDLKLQQTKDFIERWEGEASGRITTMVAPHAPYTCPKSYLKKVLSLAQELERPIHIHLSETKEEVLNSYKEHGLSPIAWVEKLGLLSHPHVLAAHCVHIDDKDMEILSKENVHVSSNPQSNLKLGCGVAPLKELLEKGVNVSLGTDGAGSNNNLNLWEEIRLASYLQKGLHQDASLMPAGETLLLATKGAAKAIGRQDELGSLTPGKRADLIFIDLDRPHLFPRHNLISHLVYSLGGGEITRVFVNGEEIISHGQLMTLHEREIMEKVEERARRLVEVE